MSQPSLSPIPVIHPLRVFGFLFAVVCSLLALVLNLHNQFTLPGVIAWILSIALWWLLLDERRPRLTRAFPSRSILLLLGVMLIAAVLRLVDLRGVPPEITLDQATNLYDADAILRGDRPIFLPGNTGRESLHIYLTAIFSAVFGLTFEAAKLVTIAEGLLTVLALFWLGRIVFEDHEQRDQAALFAAALLAVSGWHLVQSRMGLRLALMPLVTALLLGFLIRAFRQQQRRDFVLAGVVLGVGLYTYTTVRLLPLVIIGGAILSLLQQPGQRRKLLLNLASLFTIAVVIFVPLLGYMLEYPESFWSRVAGRLGGDVFAPVVDAEGTILFEGSARQGRSTGESISLLAGNYIRALGFYHVRGDQAWVNGVPYQPALDPFSGILFLVGAALFGRRLMRQRNTGYWLIALAFFILIIPSALALAYPDENPSATRLNGTMVVVYLVAGYGLAWLYVKLAQRLHYWLVRLLIVGIIAGAAVFNADLYFNQYRAIYHDASFPYRQLGDMMRDFSEETGSYGNAFLLFYPYWVDYRALAAEMGAIRWTNYINVVDELPPALYLATLRDHPNHYDPALDMLFLTAPQNERGAALLREWFPDGEWQEVISEHNRMTFLLYRVPALGQAGFEQFLAAAGDKNIINQP